MIKVTNEMVIIIEEYIETFQEHLYHNAEELARKIIELHEARKPKPEPVAYTSRGELEDLFYQAEMKAFSDKSDINDMPLYTAPPTREPLSEKEVWSLYDDSNGIINFARAIEQAHGIGVTND